MTVSEIIALISCIVAVGALALNLMKSAHGSVEQTQAIRDKLDYIADTTRDTREDVRQLDRKLDDHASRLTKIEAKVEDHGRRLDKLEG